MVSCGAAPALGARLDLIVMRQPGAPPRPELEMCAVGEDGMRIINDEVVRLARFSEKTELAKADARERALLFDLLSTASTSAGWVNVSDIPSSPRRSSPLPNGPTCLPSTLSVPSPVAATHSLTSAHLLVAGSRITRRR